MQKKRIRRIIVFGVAGLLFLVIVLDIVQGIIGRKEAAESWKTDEIEYEDLSTALQWAEGVSKYDRYPNGRKLGRIESVEDAKQKAAKCFYYYFGTAAFLRFPYKVCYDESLDLFFIWTGYPYGIFTNPFAVLIRGSDGEVLNIWIEI
jgi:hypothetical protein